MDISDDNPVVIGDDPRAQKQPEETGEEAVVSAADCQGSEIVDDAPPLAGRTGEDSGRSHRFRG